MFPPAPPPNSLVLPLRVFVYDVVCLIKHYRKATRIPAGTRLSYSATLPAREQKNKLRGHSSPC